MLLFCLFITPFFFYVALSIFFFVYLYLFVPFYFSFPFACPSFHLFSILFLSPFHSFLISFVTFNSRVPSSLICFSCVFLSLFLFLFPIFPFCICSLSFMSLTVFLYIFSFSSFRSFFLSPYFFCCSCFSFYLLTFFSKPNLTFISFRVIHSFYPSFSIRFCSLFFPSFQFNRQNLSPFSLLLHIFFVLCFNCLIYFSFPTQFEAVCLSVYWKLWLRTEIPAAGKASQRAKGTKQIRCFSLAIGPNFVLPIVNSVSCKF